MTDSEVSRRVHDAINATKAFLATDTVGSAIAGQALESLMRGTPEYEPGDSDAVRAARDGAASRAALIDLTFGFMSVTVDLLKLREQEQGVPPIDTLRWVEDLHRQTPG